MNTFSIGEALSFGWASFKKYPWILVGISFVNFLIGILTGIPILGIIFWIVSTATTMGYMKVALNTVDGIPPSLSVLFSQWSKFWKMIGAGLLISLVFVIPGIVLGFAGGFANITATKADSPMLDVMSSSAITIFMLVMLVILIFFVRYIFTFMLIVDRNAKVIEAFRLSAKITQGNRGKIILFMLSIILVNLLGVIALFVGILVTSAVTQIALAHVYRKLLAQHTTSEPLAQETVEVASITETITTVPNS